MMKIPDTLKTSDLYIKNFLKWLMVSVLTGVLCGVIGSIFHHGIDYVTKIRESNKDILYFLPIGGLLIAFFYNLFKNKGKLDTNRVIDSAKNGEEVPFIIAPLILSGTIITHFFGGSAGREGAALQLGGSIGYNLGKLLRLNKEDIRAIVMAGMSSTFAALFGTPLTATVFTLEVARVGSVNYTSLVPCIISSIVSYKIALFSGIKPVSFIIRNIPSLTTANSLKITVLAIACAAVGILFCVAMDKSKSLMKKFFPNVFLRAFLGGSLIVILTVAFNLYDYNGAGMNVISHAMVGEANWEAFIIKIIFTAITISAGFKGGEIVPAFFIGSTFGCCMGALLGVNAGFCAAIGFVAVFCSVVNCPLASVILSIEVFGSEGLLLFAIVCAVSYMMSGNFSLYKSQEFLYPKVNEENVVL